MKRRYNPEPPRVGIGSVMIDSLGREWTVVQPGTFSVVVKQVSADGTIASTSVVLSLETLTATYKKVSIKIGEHK